MCLPCNCLTWANSGRQFRFKSGSRFASSDTCRHQVDTPPTVWHLRARGRRHRGMQTSIQCAGTAAVGQGTHAAAAPSARGGPRRRLRLGFSGAPAGGGRQHWGACSAATRHTLADCLSVPGHLSLSGSRSNMSWRTSRGAAPQGGATSSCSSMLLSATGLAEPRVAKFWPSRSMLPSVLRSHWALPQGRPLAALMRACKLTLNSATAPRRAPPESGVLLQQPKASFGGCCANPGASPSLGSWMSHRSESAAPSAGPKVSKLHCRAGGGSGRVRCGPQRAARQASCSPALTGQH